ncbi:hypothetical protein MLD38_004761 [Melastoma candidum]|uniref:Uncharacterized protein n=1 Tax=Melastoma candidum TaxID=119954 RepID=A0ACB9S752_9MYRT|nr:hypothetical protein MLD38_004761 [Melastoma candidum]
MFWAGLGFIHHVSSSPDSTQHAPSNVALLVKSSSSPILFKRDSHDVEVPVDIVSMFRTVRWSINTKYYTVDVSVWMAHLGDNSEMQLPPTNKLTALVMVFYLSQPPSFRKWVSRNDMKDFDILLCIGNKVDLVPSHPVHAEYRRKIQNIGDESIDYYAALDDCGISETEGSSLLGNAGSVLEIRDSCLEWCVDNNIEYVEADQRFMFGMVC